MHGNYFSFFEEMNATARAKNEALASRAIFVNGVMEQGYRLWLTLLTTEVTEAIKAAQDLTTCKSPEDVMQVQKAWFHASSARAVTSLQGTIEIANYLVKNLQDTMSSLAPDPAALSPFAALAAPAPAPIPAPAPPPAPVAIAAPVIEAPAIVAVPVVAAPVIATPAVPATAPVVVPVPAPVVAAPVAVPVPAPVATAPAIPAAAPPAAARPAPGAAGRSKRK